ncbi:IclR family transcriptional regulator domain-containing protein [Ottowia sp. VDI28]|uniref:IclR family transcriptional regulator domain-containing protein n=1 Tax=Ottowia sp. VDI28 TaxID=3133968 RepID=UPI003C2CC804
MSGNSHGAAISAPVRDKSGEIVAAFTVTVPVSRFTKTLREQMIEAVTSAASTISSGLGFVEHAQSPRRTA